MPSFASSLIFISIPPGLTHPASSIFAITGQSREHATTYSSRVTYYTTRNSLSVKLHSPKPGSQRDSDVMSAAAASAAATVAAAEIRARLAVALYTCEPRDLLTRKCIKRRCCSRQPREITRCLQVVCTSVCQRDDSEISPVLNMQVQTAQVQYQVLHLWMIPKAVDEVGWNFGGLQHMGLGK